MSFPPISITNSFVIETTSSPLLFQEFSALLPPLDQFCSPFSRNRMNGYSRIRKDSNARSKSVDFSDLTFQHRTPNFFTNSQFRLQEPKPNLTNAARVVAKHSSIPEEGTGEVFGIILSQKCPIHSESSDQSAASPGLKTISEQDKSLTIIRSSSVSHGYSRIQSQLDSAAETHDQRGIKLTAQNRYVKKKGKFLKAFMRVFGL